MKQLEKYKKKRNFASSPEPTGELIDSGYPMPIFVIQRHDSRNLHFDLRLEHKGVLLSWAITRKPVLNKDYKRLAVHVEDHPLDYANFEGLIPKGNYGAGIVEIWDKGFYYLENATSREEIERVLTDKLPKGHFILYLKGQKMDGKFVLVKLSQSKEDWLFYYDNADRQEPDKADDEVFFGFSPPMLPTLIDKPFDGKDWLFEPKLDGYRISAVIDNDNIKLISRNGKDFTSGYPLIVNELKKLGVKAILDGELVAIDADGRPSFSLLHDGSAKNILYYAFDILYLKRSSLMHLPLFKRKMILDEVVEESVNIKKLFYQSGEGVKLFSKVTEMGFEGVVAKKSSSLYESGRTDDWLKFKTTKTLDLTIVGYIPDDTGSFKSLMVGEDDGLGHYIYRGNVGTGFSENSRNAIIKMFEETDRTADIILNLPKDNQMVLVRPQVVAELKYLELTADGRLRHPVFKRIRDDKS